MKHILVASDFSVASVTSFNYAIYMAQLSGAKLSILHAGQQTTTQPNDTTDNATPLLIDLIATISPDFAQAIEQAHSPETLRGIAFEYIHTNKLDADRLSELVRKNQIDLVVIDARPRRGLQEMMFGNYLEQVLDRVKCCPIMAVSQNATFKPLKNIWYSTVMLTPSETLARLRDFSCRISDTLHVVHVIVEPTRSYPERVKDFRKRVENIFGDYPYTFKEIEDADVETALLDNIKEENIDMMIMIERPKTTFDRMFMNSMTQLMALNSTIPVAVFHELDGDMAVADK